VEQATHVEVGPKQTLLLPWQSADVLQPTQAPPAVQIGVDCPHDESSVHRAWHWWSPGQHEGADTPQS